MRKSRYRRRMEKISAKRAAAGRKSQLAQKVRREREAREVYELARIIEVKRPDGSVAATWRVYATGEPNLPLCVDFGNELHRYMSVRRLAPLLARKMFGCI